MLSKQLNVFLTLSVLSITSVEANIFSDIYEDWIKPAVNEVSEITDTVIGFMPGVGVWRASARMRNKKEKWECGPDHENKYIADLAHIGSEYLVALKTSCWEKWERINNCCKGHDTCCREFVPRTNRTERFKRCDPTLYGCWKEATSGDSYCRTVTDGWRKLMEQFGDNDWQYDAYIKRTNCEEGESKCASAFNSCTKKCNDEKTCSNEHKDCMGTRNGGDCNGIKRVKMSESELMETEKKEEEACQKLCERSCLDQQKACYSQCGNTKQQCDDECTKCSNGPLSKCKGTSADLCFPSGHEQAFKDAQGYICQCKASKDEKRKCEAKHYDCYSTCGNKKDDCDAENRICWNKSPSTPDNNCPFDKTYVFVPWEGYEKMQEKACKKQKKTFKQIPADDELEKPENGQMEKKVTPNATTDS